MRRGRILIYLALLLIIGVLAVVFLVPQIMPGDGETEVVEEPTPTPVLTTNVVVVVQTIPLGTEIKPEYLGTVPMPMDTLVEGLYMEDIESAIGRRAKYDLQPGVILNDSYLADSPEDVAQSVSDISFMVDPGYVAVSIPITRLSSVSYALKPGDRVNVIVTLMLVDLDTEFQSKLPNLTAGVLAPGPAVLLGYQQQDTTTANIQSDEKLRSIAAQVVGGGEVSPYGRALLDPFLEQTFYQVPSEPQRPRMVSQTLIQDVKVVLVGTYKQEEQEVEQTKTQDEVVESTPTPPVPQGEVVATPTPERPDLITLVVSPQDAVTLNYLIYSGGQLSLALRPVVEGDTPLPQTQAVTLDFLLSNYNITRPVKMDIGVEPRVDDLTPPELPNDIIITPIP